MVSILPKSRRLFGETRTAVLGLLLSRPDEQFHLREIARQAGTGLGAVQRELSHLTELGIIKRQPQGNQTCYQADRRCAYFPELQGLILKTTGVVAVLARSFEPMAARIKVAVVFGSMAHGAMQADSDVDVLMLSDNLTMRELGAAIHAAGQLLNREINVNLYKPADWRKRVVAGHPLATQILSNPTLVILGDVHELEPMA